MLNMVEIPMENNATFAFALEKCWKKYQKGNLNIHAQSVKCVNVFLKRSFHRLNSLNRPNDQAGIAIFYEHIEEKLAKTVMYLGLVEK